MGSWQQTRARLSLCSVHLLLKPTACFLFAGVLTSWAAPACNNPVFAEIVPADMRNIVYAFDRSFEGALSALGAPLVGYAAEHWFGFVKSEGASGEPL